MVSNDNSACPTRATRTASAARVTLNGIPIQVPCNMVIQLPASTMTWAEFVRGGPDASAEDHSPFFPRWRSGWSATSSPARPIAPASCSPRSSRPTWVSADRQIDYDTGNLLIDTGDPAHPAVVQINDPKGRFGRAQSPDARFSVDDQNPTIHAGTGLPDVRPRGPVRPKGDDPLCPQQNRPKADRARRTAAAATSPTRARPLPGSGELGAPRGRRGVLHAVRDAGRRRPRRPATPTPGSRRRSRSATG